MREVGTTEGEFELLAKMTARLASTANVDEICDTVLEEIVALGFGAAWIALLDERTGNLITVREVIDNRDTTPEMPRIFMADVRQPIGVGFRERRMVNIADPSTLLVLEDCGGVVPEGKMALPRIIFEHLRGNPFACGPLLGSRGQAVGALGLSSYRGHQPIPDDVLRSGLLRAFRDHLGIAMERALAVQRQQRLNADLLRAQEQLMASARLKAVGELATAVAHDLNHLAGIALMAVSVGAQSPDKAFDMLPRIERANRAIGGLVERLQRAAGRGNGATQTCINASELIEDIVSMMSPMCREAAIAVESDIAPLLYAVGDRAALQQIVINLFKNAYDALVASEAAEREICVVAARAGTEIRVAVTDSGPGIPADLLERVFEPFVTTREDTHVGLGLATAHAAVKHFGGTIAAANAPGGGASLTFTLTAASEAVVQAADDAARSHQASPQPLRVLAVDDDEDIVDLIQQYLQPLDCDTVCATDALDALNLAQQQTFDMVLCDVGMPGKNGLDLCSALRKGGCTSKLVLITGWDGAVVKADGRFGHCDAILQKPFVGSDIVDIVQQLFPSSAR